jgi:hypothetical protein
MSGGQIAFVVVSLVFVCSAAVAYWALRAR